MIIQSLERGFSVIRIIGSSDDTDILVCKDLLEDTNDVYTLICLKDPDLIYRAMPLFTEQRKNRSFSDYIECFSQNGYFYAVFKNRDKRLLYDRFEEELFALKERLNMAKNMFAAMTLQDMPDGIQCEALRRDNLMTDESQSVYFNYYLRDISSYGVVSFRDVQAETARVMRRIFERELVNKESRELEDFILNLEIGTYKTRLEMYREYDKLYGELLNLIDNGEVKPKGFFYKLWERIKRLARFIKPVLVTLLLIAAFAYLIFTLGDDSGQSTATGTGGKIDQIGTVAIEEGK